MKDLVSARNGEKTKPANSLKSAETSAAVLGSVRYLCKIRLCEGLSLCLVWWHSQGGKAKYPSPLERLSSA